MSELAIRLVAEHGWPSSSSDPAPLPTGDPLIAGVNLCIEALSRFEDGDDVRVAASMLALALSTIESDAELADVCQLLLSPPGIVEAFCDLLEDHQPESNTDALLVLGNLVIDAKVAAEAKRRIHAAGGFEKLLAHLYTGDATTLLYAAGAVMNALYSADQVTLIQRLGVLPRLQELAGSDQVELVQYASGCLHNMRALNMQHRQQQPHLALTESTPQPPMQYPPPPQLALTGPAGSGDGGAGASDARSGAADAAGAASAVVRRRSLRRSRSAR